MACQGTVISQPVIFEYKEPGGPHHDGHQAEKYINNTTDSVKQNYWRTLLLQKLEALDICIGQEKEIFQEASLGISEVGRI